MTTELAEKVAVRAIILVDHNKVLLGKRARGVGIGQYALIGGKPDEGESEEQGIRRETGEEVGLGLRNLVFWKDEANDKTIPGQTWRTYYFIGEAEGKVKLKLDEIEEVVEIDRRNLKDFDIAFGHREILEEFFGLR